jgi:hypothetical protein
MMSWYHDNDENNSFITPAFDAAGGMRLYFSDHSGIALSYSLRTPLESFFQTFNQKLTLGWLIRY